MHSWSRSVTMSMLRAREVLMGPFRPFLAAEGLTEPQWRVLRVLSEVEQISLSEVAQSTLLLLPSVSRIVRDLEAKGFIQRKSLGIKANQTHIQMRAKGKALVAKLLPRAEECLAVMAKQYGAQRLAELQAHLDAFAALKV